MSIKIGIGKNLKITPSPSGIVYEPEIYSYIAGLSTSLGANQLFLLDRFIKAIKTGFGITALSAHFDCMWILAGETEESGLRNLVKRDHDCTSLYSGRWVQYEGYDGAIGVCVLKTDYNASTDAVKFARDDNSFGCYIRKDAAASNTVHSMGVSDSITPGAFRLQPWRATLNYQSGYNQATTAANIAVTDKLGMLTSVRTASNSQKVARNKTFGAVNATASLAFPVLECYLMCYNNNGAVGGYETGQESFAWIGASLSQAQLDCLVDSFEAYMDARGKGVIV
jgi:hypothetical protein